MQQLPFLKVSKYQAVRRFSLLSESLPLCLKAAFTSLLLRCRELSVEWVSGLSADIWIETSCRSEPPSRHPVADGDAGHRKDLALGVQLLQERPHWAEHHV